MIDDWLDVAEWVALLAATALLLVLFACGCARCDHATRRTTGRAAAGVPDAPVARDLGTIRWEVDID